MRFIGFTWGECLSTAIHILLLTAATTVEVLYVVAVWGGCIMLPGLITLLKGQRAAFILGLAAAGLIWLVASFRLAHPGSWWARRFYSAAKMERSQARHGG